MSSINKTVIHLLWLFSLSIFGLNAASDETANTASLNLQVESPDWRDQVIYFLMIDRFNNGDTSNDDQGVGVFDPNKESHYSGGDIEGIQQKLNYIQNLGATAIWITPPVANQWWSKASEYAGYHGYWARHFKKVDEHYGSLNDYKRLSSALHDRKMYLIQDIVLNHTGIFFGYEGNYHPQNTAQNFTLYETGFQAAPEMTPFDQINRLDPNHVAANIYNWTPSASNYTSKEQQFTYQLSNLADINTKNPQVLTAFKDAYRYWIDEVGVDAYRIDTVKYVEHEFWHHFLHDKDGIYSAAQQHGKSHFLTFGEVFESSSPYSDNGERVVTEFLGTQEQPQLNSVIGFPLYFDINRVFAEGQPTSELAYRLTQFMTKYPDPYVIPNFIDNHDTKRFLSAASVAALKQALTLIFTIPGIPVIYQGTEQALLETRQAMFSGGFGSTSSQFDEEAQMYQFIQSLSALRTQNRLFTRGKLNILESNDSSAGLLAYSRDYQQNTALILMNTAEHNVLVSRMKTGLSKNTPLKTLFSTGNVSISNVDNRGELTLTLPARSILVLQADKHGEYEVPDTENTATEEQPIDIHWTTHLSGTTVLHDVELTGTVSRPNHPLQLVINGNMDTAITFNADESGLWNVILPIRDLGATQYRVEIFDPINKVSSASQQLVGLIEDATISLQLADPVNDANGLLGNTRPPKHAASQGQMEIQAVTAKAAGGNLSLSFNMSHISDDWLPANGFDNVSFSLFFDIPNKKGQQTLPQLNAKMPNKNDWDIAHVAYGWGNYMYLADGATANHTGSKIGVAPKVSVNKDTNTITFFYTGNTLGITDWQGVAIYATTWDIAGEGYYRDISAKGGEWVFTGANENAAKILDSVFLELKN